MFRVSVSPLPPTLFLRMLSRSDLFSCRVAILSCIRLSGTTCLGDIRRNTTCGKVSALSSLERTASSTGSAIKLQNA